MLTTYQKVIIRTFYSLTQLINVPTRVTQDSKGLLDIIATNNESSNVSTNVSPLSIGDHDMIGCVRNINNVHIESNNKQELQELQSR